MNQIVVRTYDETLKGSVLTIDENGNEILSFPDGNFTSTKTLVQHLNLGYKVVMCNQIGMCLEYILQKD